MHLRSQQSEWASDLLEVTFAVKNTIEIDVTFPYHNGSIARVPFFAITTCS